MTLFTEIPLESPPTLFCFFYQYQLGFLAFTNKNASRYTHRLASICYLLKRLETSYAQMERFGASERLIA